MSSSTSVFPSNNDAMEDCDAHPSPRKATHQPRHRAIPTVFRYWGLECTLLLLAIALLIAIAVTAREYDGKRVPEWRFSINLNTLVALLSTILRAVLAFILAEVMSQDKWAWFSERTRPLDHIQTFDDASRGVPGSISLIGVLRFGFRGHVISLIAALAMIVSQATGPFTQQAIKTVSCVHPRTDLPSSVNVANYIPGKDRMQDFGVGMGVDIDEPFKGAMINALTTQDDSSLASVPFQCPTGNCTFPDLGGVTYSSIGMCSMCMDVSAYVRRSDVSSEESISQVSKMQLESLLVGNDNIFPFPHLGVNASDFATMQAGMPADFARIAGQALLNITLLTLTNAPPCESAGCPRAMPNSVDNLSYVGVACAFHTCLKNLHGEIVDGELREKVHSTVPTRLDRRLDGTDRDLFNLKDSISKTQYAIRSPCLVDGEVYDTSNFSLAANDTSKRILLDLDLEEYTGTVPSECVYQIDGAYAGALGKHMSTLFRGECTPVARGPMTCSGEFWTKNFYAGGNATHQTVAAAMEGFAEAVTRYLRATGLGPLLPWETTEAHTTGLPVQTAVGREALARGEVQETTVCILLDWTWLFFPAGLCLAALVVLAATMVRNVRDGGRPPWKSSVLPFLFYDLAPAGREAAPPLGGGEASYARLKQEAEKTKVQFDYGEEESGDYGSGAVKRGVFQPGHIEEVQGVRGRAWERVGRPGRVREPPATDMRSIISINSMNSV